MRPYQYIATLPNRKRTVTASLLSSRKNLYFLLHTYQDSQPKTLKRTEAGLGHRYFLWVAIWKVHTPASFWGNTPD